MTTQPTKKKIVFKIKHLAAITQDVWINSKSYITNPDEMVEMASTNQALIDDVGRQLNELKNELEMDADAVCEKCGDGCDTLNQMDGHMKCPDCELLYTQSISYLKHRLEMGDDDDDIHICGETGKQYDTDPNPKLGCGIRCDDENGMIGNISYCIGCMEE
tara:strand:+ start:282 stop:764 length:483 start_codon:yes stop_codon:yes gene_type:complete